MKNMVKYRLTPATKADIKGIWNYTDDKWGTTQADKYVKLLERRIQLLAKTPGIGKPRDEVRPEYFSCPEGKQIIFYRIKKDHIEVVRILHESMEPNLHFS